MNHRRLTHMMHSRGAAQLLALPLIVMLVCGAVYTPAPLRGALTAGALLGGGWGIVTGVLITCAIALLLQLANKQYNILRYDSAMAPLMVLVVSLASPALACSLSPGNIVALLMVAGSAVLFTAYEFPMRRRRVFLLFFMQATAAIYIQQLLWYLPVLLVGCMQMRIFSLRTLLAALLGAVTPLWIAGALAWVTPVELYTMFDIPGLQLGEPDMATFTVIGSAALTALLAIVMLCANTVKLLAFNARTRALNGYFTLLLLTTIAIAAADIVHVALMMPLLTAMAGYQTALFFATRRGDMSWMGAVAVLLLYCAVWCWNVFNESILSYIVSL